MKLVDYTEIGDVTKIREYREVGWSLLDASVIYRCKTTVFSISDGIISVDYGYVNEDGTEYKLKAYKNVSHGFTNI